MSFDQHSLAIESELQRFRITSAHKYISPEQLDIHKLVIVQIQ